MSSRRTVNQDRPGTEHPSLTPGQLGVISAWSPRGRKEPIMEHDRKAVDDVGMRDLKFAMTGILVIVAIAVLLAIVS